MTWDESEAYRVEWGTSGVTIGFNQFDDFTNREILMSQIFKQVVAHVLNDAYSALLEFIAKSNGQHVDTMVDEILVFSEALACSGNANADIILFGESSDGGSK